MMKLETVFLFFLHLK